MINKNKRKINLFVLIAIIVVIPFVSIGYSALSTVLNIRSDVASIHFVPRTVTFPDKIEDILDNESCVVRYEDDVTDEVNNTVSAKNVYFNKCANKRNIIFGGFC